MQMKYRTTDIINYFNYHFPLMPKLTHEALQEVISYRGFPAVSIYIPTAQYGPDINQNPVRFKNKIREVKEQLNKQQDLDKKVINNLIEKLETYLNNLELWQKPDASMAVFVSETANFNFQLPFTTVELHHINSRFVIKPLLEQFNENIFYTLAISPENVRLIKCSNFECNEIDLPPEVPRNLEDAVGKDIYQKEFQAHGVSGTGSNTMFGHGQEIQDSMQHNSMIYLKKVADSLSHTLKLDQQPVIVAADDSLLPTFKKVASNYKILIDPGVEVSPDRLSIRELYDLAWPKVKPVLESDVERMIQEYHDGVGRDLATSDLEKVLLAAEQGRIRTLLVAKNKEIWGTFNFETKELEIKPDQDVQTDDLLDMAALKVLQTNGEIYLLHADQMPDGKEVVALYRY